MLPGCVDAPKRCVIEPTWFLEGGPHPRAALPRFYILIQAFEEACIHGRMRYHADPV